MSPTYSAGRREGLRLDSKVMGQAQPCVVTFRGIEYPGEVVVAETVDPAWG